MTRSYNRDLRVPTYLNIWRHMWMLPYPFCTWKVARNDSRLLRLSFCFFFDAQLFSVQLKNCSTEKLSPVVNLWFSKTVLFKIIQKCKEFKVKYWVQCWGEKLLDDVVEDSVLRLCDKVRLVLNFLVFSSNLSSSKIWIVKFKFVKNLNFLITCIFLQN